MVLLPEKSHGQEEPRGLQSMGSQGVGHDQTKSRGVVPLSDL